MTAEHAATLVADWQRLGLIDNADTDVPAISVVQAWKYGALS